MKKENVIKDLSIYNINTYSSKFYKNKKKTSVSQPTDFINKFKLECVIGKGGFGKVSYIIVFNNK
jgi:hypothetical protein